MTFYKSSNEMKTEKKGYPSRKMVGKDESVCKILWRPIRIIFLSLTIFTLTFLAYLGLYTVLNNMTTPVQTVTVSSEGPAAEIYPDYMGQYNILRDIYRSDRAVFKHVDREDRFIIYTGRNAIVFLYKVVTLQTSKDFLSFIKRKHSSS